MISSNFFAVMGVEPIPGRTFRPEEDKVGAAPVAIIGAGLWEENSDRHQDIIGKPITLTGK